MRNVTLLLALFLAALPIAAQLKCDELVPKLMEISNMDAALQTVPDGIHQMADSLLNSEGSMDLDKKKALESLLLHAIDPDRLRKNIQDKLLAHCDPAIYGEALQEMQSPLSMKMLQLEMRPHSSAEEMERARRFLASFLMQSPRESRMRLIRSLMEATHDVDTYADSDLAVSTHIIKIVRSAPSKDEIEAARNDLLPRIQEGTEAEDYYVYRSASDEELQQYIALQETKAMQRLNQDMAKAFVDAAGIEGENFGLQIKKVVAEKHIPVNPNPTVH